MADETYTYSLATNFGGSINLAKLEQEIENSEITIALRRIDLAGDVVDIIFKAALSASEEDILDGGVAVGGLIAAHDSSDDVDTVLISAVDPSGNPALIKQDSSNNLVMVPEPRDGDKYNKFSINWCDKCSWYQSSTKVTTETLSDSGDGLTFNSANTHWIDMTHGRITDEDNIVAEAGSDNWIPVITVDDVEQTVETDYTINYENGTVTFSSSQSGNVVKATYWYASSGTYALTVPAGKTLQLLRVEVQFSKNITLNDTMLFTPKGYAGVFAPHLVPSPLAATDLVALASPYKYKNAKDYINESNGSHPLVPAWGELSDDVVILVWEYLSRTDLNGDAGMRIEVSMENDTVHTGEIAVLTFYGILKDT